MHIKSKPKFISVSQMDPCRRACPFDLISVMYHIPTRFTNTTRWSLWRNTATNDPFPDPKLPFAWGNFRIHATSWYNPWQTRLYHPLAALKGLSRAERLAVRRRPDILWKDCIILYILYALMLLLQRMVLLKGNERQPNPENISLQPRDGCKLRKVVDHGKDKAAMIIRSA